MENEIVQAVQEVQEPHTEPTAPQEKMFTQTEVDAIVGRRVSRAMKGMPGEEELTAFRAWKESQKTEQERWDTMVQERDAARASLAEAQAKVEQYQREKILLEKGVDAADIDYFTFKIGKMVTDTKSFDQAATEFLQEYQRRPRVQMTASLTGGNPHQRTENEVMNALIRQGR